MGPTGTEEHAVGTAEAAMGTAEAAMGTAAPAVGTVAHAVGTAEPATGTAEAAMGTVAPAVGTVAHAVGTAEPATGTASNGVRRRSSGGNAVVNISARVDYGVRVLCALAATDGPMTSEQLASAQDLPHKYLESVLTELRRGGLLVAKRGADGGYRLARPAAEISLADAIRSLVGTLAEVRGRRPEGTTYDGPAEHLRAVWLGVRAHLESVLEEVTIDRIVSGDLPDLPAPVAEVVPDRS